MSIEAGWYNLVPVKVQFNDGVRTLYQFLPTCHTRTGVLAEARAQSRDLGVDIRVVKVKGDISMEHADPDAPAPGDQGSLIQEA